MSCIWLTKVKEKQIKLRCFIKIYTLTLSSTVPWLALCMHPIATTNG